MVGFGQRCLVRGRVGLGGCRGGELGKLKYFFLLILWRSVCLHQDAARGICICFFF